MIQRVRRFRLNASCSNVDIPLTIRLAGDAPRPFGLVDGGVADAEAPGGLAG